MNKSNYRFTKFPNEVIDSHMKKLTGSEYKLLSVLLRKTVGFHRESDKISTSQFMEITGLSNQGVNKGIKALVKKGLITECKHNTQTKAYKINDHLFAYEEISQAIDSHMNKSHKSYEKNSQVTPETYEGSSHTKEREKENKKESPPPPGNTREQAKKLAECLHTTIQSQHNDMTIPQPNLHDWAIEIEKILLEYQCSPDLIKKVIIWGCAEEFWCSKIINASKLRKHFKTMKMQMEPELNKINREKKFEPKQM